jgi:hypothetical protein
VEQGAPVLCFAAAPCRLKDDVLQVGGALLLAALALLAADATRRSYGHSWDEAATAMQVSPLPCRIRVAHPCAMQAAFVRLSGSPSAAKFPGSSGSSEVGAGHRRRRRRAPEPEQPASSWWWPFGGSGSVVSAVALKPSDQENNVLAAAWTALQAHAVLLQVGCGTVVRITDDTHGCFTHACSAPWEG